MYFDRSFRDYPMKYEFIDELNFKDCVCLRIKTTSKFFVGFISKNRKFIIHTECFGANNIFSHPFIHNIKHKPNMVQDLSIKINLAI